MKKIISIICLVAFILSIFTAAYADVNEKSVKLSKQELAAMHPDERSVVEKALKDGKKLMSRSTEVYYFYRDENGKPIIKSKSEADETDIILPQYISKSELTLTLYKFDNTQEGSSYPVDYSFMGWFDWDNHDNLAGEYDYAGIYYAGDLAIYGSDEIAYDSWDNVYSGVDNIGCQDIQNNAGYVSYYRNYNGGFLDHGWVFVDARQNFKENREANVSLKYIHTYSDMEFSVTISFPPGITITPTSDQWSVIDSTTFWY